MHLKDEGRNQESQKIFEGIRLLGDYHHNCNVLQLKKGEIIVVRKPSNETSIDAEDYVPCMHCYGFFKGDELFRHVKICKFKEDPLKSHTKVKQEARMLLPSTTDDAQLQKHVLLPMRNDNISSTAKSDQLILKFGSRELEKVGIDQSQHVSQRMRQLARLLNTLRQVATPCLCLSDYLDTTWFDHVVDAVKVLCNFNSEVREQVQIPSLALKLGHSIKKCAQIVKSEALRAKDTKRVKNIRMFLELLDDEWSIKISSRSLASISLKRYNKVDYLPLTEDIQLLRHHLDRKISRLTSQLNESAADDHLWLDLAKATLARIIMFNKRRSGETSKMEVQMFLSRPDWNKTSTTTRASLTPLEIQLSQR